MQRREFSITAAALATTATLVTPVVFAQGKPPQEGTDFLVLDKLAPTEAGAGKIEVVEFFWYSCPHCNRFEPQLQEWVKKMPKDVVLRRAPVAFRPDFEPQQRLYFVLEALGKVEELHSKVFNAIHVERQLLNTAELVAAWAEKQGINKAKFTEAYNSFPVATTHATPRPSPTPPTPPSDHPQTASASGGCCFSTCLRYLPVWLVGCSATVSGVPTTTISPPLSPPSGPRSMIQSAQRITSRLCSDAQKSLRGSEVSGFNSRMRQISSHFQYFSSQKLPFS